MFVYCDKKTNTFCNTNSSSLLCKGHNDVLNVIPGVAFKHQTSLYWVVFAIFIFFLNLQVIGIYALMLNKDMEIGYKILLIDFSFYDTFHGLGPSTISVATHT